MRVAAMLALTTVAVANAAAPPAKVVLQVGINSTDFDTLNPIVGATAVDFDVWNAQYATLTNKAAEDFATIPGLAESWSAASDGRTFTYTLRAGLTWSDGAALTARDVAFTINRSRVEAWQNYTAFTQHLTARVVDARTVAITSSVPDPKLPGLGDVYILPEHIWGKLDAQAITKYVALDGVGSGPFTLVEWKRGQFLRMQANLRYWAGQRPVEEIVFRNFNNPDAMVAALKKGELDVAHGVPGAAFHELAATRGIVAIEGQQGGFDEIAINGGAGLAKPHPALLDRRVRVAMAHAIDKKVLLDRVWLGIGAVAQAVSPSADPVWTPDIPMAERFEFDLVKASALLEQAGYRDTDGDGIREMPGGGRPLEFGYYFRTEAAVAAPVAEFVSGWMRKIGIRIKLKPTTAGQLTSIIGKGTYDMFHWSWTPYVDPDPQISCFRCNQIAQAADPGAFNNDANLCDPEYDRLYAEQNRETDRAKRIALVHRMLTRFHDTAVYSVLALTPDLQAYRTDRFSGWVRQPAGVGPVIFSNTTPTYARLEPIVAPVHVVRGFGGARMAGMLAAVLAALLLLGWTISRRRSVDERD
jgi:peptide/nickel transport system substrate-binding protein